MKVGRDPAAGLGLAKGLWSSWGPIAGSQRQLCHSCRLAADIFAEFLVPTRG